MSKLNPLFLIPSCIYWWWSGFFLTTEVPLKTPNLQEAKLQMQKYYSNKRSLPQDQAISSNFFQPQQMKITSPLALFTSHLKSEANIHPRAELTSPLHILSRIYLQSQIQSPNVIIPFTIFTWFVGELFWPFQIAKSTFPKDKANECGVAQTLERIPKEFQNNLGPWSHHRINWSLIRYVGFFRIAGALHKWRSLHS